MADGCYRGRRMTKPKTIVRDESGRPAGIQ